MRRFAAALLVPLLLVVGCGSADPPPAAPEDSQSAGPSLNEWTPTITAVFPQGKTLAQSYGVNVGIWPTKSVLCSKLPSPKISLYVSKDGEPGELVDVQPALTMREASGVKFPSEEFNDVPASLAADPGAKFHFVAYVRGRPASNVWLHTGEKPSPGTAPVKPTGYSSPEPASVDARIQIVFPHDEQGRAAPVKSATRVNVAVDVFQHSTTLSVAPDSAFVPQLWVGQGSARLAALPPGVQKTTYTVEGQGYPRWVFNDVAVKPGETYHFLASVGLLGPEGGSYPTIWTYSSGSHAAAQPPTPPACIP